MRKTIRLLLGTAMICWSAGAASADEVKMFTDGVPSVDELAVILFGHKESAPSSRTRGITFLGDPTPQAARPTIVAAKQPDATPTASNAASPEPSAFGFNIRFGFDSTQIVGESQPYLDQVGELLKRDEAQGKAVVIVGHTDASGPAAYNQALSQRRASAVQRYLAQRHGIPSARLQIAALGERQPLSGADPYDPKNRRVEFHLAQ